MAKTMLATTTATILFLILFVSPRTTMADEEIKDANGNPLKFGQSYYIVPTLRSNGGGMSMIAVGSPICPAGFKVIQTSDGFQDLGIPVTFTPYETPSPRPVAGSVILSNQKVSIRFNYLKPSPFCRIYYSQMWGLMPIKEVDTFANVILADYQAFSISNSSSACGGYHIMYRSVVGATRVYPISVVVDSNGQRFLGLNRNRGDVLQVDFLPTNQPALIGTY